MKIGEFIHTCHTTKDTVRYYVSAGLLFPRKKGSQLDFSERDLEDFRYIQRLKEMRFNIQEIREVLQNFRMSNGVEAATMDTYEQLLTEKRHQLLLEREMLDRSVDLIEKERAEVKKLRTAGKKGRGGVPLTAVSLLCCPVCRSQLSIEQAELQFKYIYRGILTCRCGYEAKIRDGIVCTGNLYTGDYDRPDLKRELYHDTGEEWDLCMHNCTDQMLEQIGQMDLRGKVIFEANVNGFFFTYHFLHELPKDCLYIFVDKYGEVLRMYKNYIETLYADLDVLYIADAGEHYPLKDQSIDVQFGFLGENEYTFYHDHHQIRDLDPLLKDHAEILQIYNSCEIGSRSIQNYMQRYPEGGMRRGNIRYLTEDYEACGFQMDLMKIGDVYATKKHHSYQAHVDGEPLTVYVCHARRKQEKTETKK